MASYAIFDRSNTLKQDHSMEDPGRRLKRIREMLNLTVRDVENKSQIIAERRRSHEYRLNISRVSEIENHSVVPSMYRIYSLCAIYRLDYIEVLGWYGVILGDLPADAMAIDLATTHPIQFDANVGEITVPLSLDPGIDVKKTTFLSRVVSKWGKLPLALLSTMETKKFRYAFIGSEDWNMYPMIQPGALVTIDDSRRKIINSGWSNEFERPIYFMEHRNGFACCWCTVSDDSLVLQPHPASLCPPQVFKFPQDVDIIGQVTGVAMLLDLERRQNIRT
jgi:transcriptional regulator with XRE-family HTH domain